MRPRGKDRDGCELKQPIRESRARAQSQGLKERETEFAFCYCGATGGVGTEGRTFTLSVKCCSPRPEKVHLLSGGSLWRVFSQLERGPGCLRQLTSECQVVKLGIHLFLLRTAQNLVGYHAPSKNSDNFWMSIGGLPKRPHPQVRWPRTCWQSHQEKRGVFFPVFPDGKERGRQERRCPIT